MNDKATTPQIRLLMVFRMLLFVPTWLIVSVLAWLCLVAAIPGQMGEAPPIAVRLILAGAAVAVLVLGWLLVRQRRGRFVAGWAVLLLAFIAVWLALQATGKAAYDREAAKWRSIGGVIDYGELVPAVPAEQNAAISYREATVALYRDAKGPEQLESVLRNPWEAEGLAEIVRSQSQSLGLLHEAAGRSQCVWTEELSGLDPKTCSMIAGLLAAEAVTHSRGGDLEAAGRSIVAGLRYSEALTADRAFNSHHMCAVIQHVMLNTYERVFSESSEAAPQVEAMLAGLDHRSAMRQALMAIPTRAFIARGPDRAGPLAPLGMFWSFACGQMDPGVAPWVFVPGNVYRDLAANLQWWRQAVEVYSPAFYKQDRSSLTSPTDLPSCAVFTRQMLESISIEDYAWPIDALESRIQLAILAGRLRAAKRKIGQYPDTLDVLGNVPVDPWNGKPIGYRRDGDGFILISGAPIDMNNQISWRWSK